MWVLGSCLSLLLFIALSGSIRCTVSVLSVRMADFVSSSVPRKVNIWGLDLSGKGWCVLDFS